MQYQYVAKALIFIQAPSVRVWDALVNPVVIRQYMFGTQVVSDWHEGSPIFWQGEWQGKTYEDKGVILKLDPEHILEYSHYSPLTGQPDVPESYHTVTIELFRMETGTSVTLSQDNNATEEDRQHSQQNWTMMLTSLKRVVETSA